jgi:hypothetical protein
MPARRKRPSKRAAKRKPLKIKRPGALTTQKRPGETTVQTARRLRKSGTPLQRKQANFYLSVLRPATNKRKKRTARKSGAKRRRK